MKFSIQLFICFCFILCSKLSSANALNQNKVVEYHLTIDYKYVNFTGKTRKAIAVNNLIPAPVLEFNLGDTAVIYVHNKLDTETSVHWHGLLLPNLQDGVSYLTTPPILPNSSYRFEFPIKHVGTYWYHSHTGLQEQLGVYGGITIHDSKPSHQYDHELTVVLSDWTDENPKSVLKNLIRHNEWYNIVRKTGQPLLKSFEKGLTKERWILYQNRMPDMHIADIAYDAFLSNGQLKRHYKQFKPGERVRVRLINAAASTYFWLNANVKLEIIAADGVDVEPAGLYKLLMAIAETYDAIITIPDDGALEIKATAMDGSGSTSIYLGDGQTIKAPNIESPDYFELMKIVATMHENGGHQKHVQQPYTKLIPPKKQSINHNDNEHAHHDHLAMMAADNDDTKLKQRNNQAHSKHHVPREANIITDFNYDFLKSTRKTTLPDNRPIREIMLNLDADMLRYIWTMNGKPLYAADKILIKKGEIVRIIMNNNTMMHHPMHLHGHFFRVINKNGDYSPLKHTVDVPPFESVTIEFAANEAGDWFFHCHVLYHMKQGMSRILSYGTPRNPALAPYPFETILKRGRAPTFLYDAKIQSQQVGFDFRAVTADYEYHANFDIGLNENIDIELSYDYYLTKYLRYFVGLEAENEHKDNVDEIDIHTTLGLRYRLLSILDTHIQMDTQLRPKLELDLHLAITERLVLIWDYEHQFDFNLTNQLEDGVGFQSKATYELALEYIDQRQLSIVGSYDNRFGLGAGIYWKF